MTNFPIHINLTNKPCLIIGGGKVALRKLNKLLDYGALVTVVAIDFIKGFSRFTESKHVNLEKKAYATGDIDRYYFVIIATDNPKLNASIAREAAERRVLYNIIDRTDIESVLMPASLTKNGITASVATGGQSPKLSQYLLGKIAEIIDDIPKGEVEQLGQNRRQIIDTTQSDLEKAKRLEQSTQALIHTLEKGRTLKNKIIRVGSRRSKLALYQTHHIINKLKANYPDYQFEIVEFITKGDKILDKGFKDIGGKGLFIKELQDAMTSGDIDFAVHSYKDMPTELGGATKIAAVDKRVSPFDALVMPENQTVINLPNAPIIGTSSIRRAVQLMSWNSQLSTKMLRGNVPTRVGKLDNGDYDGIVLAVAGLTRLGLGNRITTQFTADQMIPAVAQGAIVIEAPIDTKYQAMFDSINHKPTEIATSIERIFLKAIGGSCSDPVGAYAELDGNKITIFGLYGDAATMQYVRGYTHSGLLEAKGAAQKFAEKLIRKLELHDK